VSTVREASAVSEFQTAEQAPPPLPPRLQDDTLSPSYIYTLNCRAEVVGLPSSANDCDILEVAAVIMASRDLRLSNATVQMLQRREKARELARTNPSASAARAELERSEDVEDPADERTRVLRHCDRYKVNGAEVEIKMRLEPGEDALVQILAVDCTMPELEDWRFEFGKSYHEQEEEPRSPGFGRPDDDADSSDNLAPMLSYERYPFADFSRFCHALGKKLSSPEFSQSCSENDEIAS